MVNRCPTLWVGSYGGFVANPPYHLTPKVGLLGCSRRVDDEKLGAPLLEVGIDSWWTRTPDQGRGQASTAHIK
jgi:hypothetical protein